MAAGYGTATPQIVAPNQPIVSLDNTCPCTQGLIFKRSGGGVIDGRGERRGIHPLKILSSFGEKE